MYTKLARRLQCFVLVIMACSMLAGCMGSEPALPLAKAYKQVALGGPFAIPTNLPDESKSIQEGRVWEASHWTDWDGSTGATEWLTVLTDEQGMVIAKRYQTQGERGDLVSLRYRLFYTSEWKCLADEANVQGRIESVRQICKIFELESLAGKPESPIPAVEWSDDQSDDRRLMPGEIGPWELLEAAASDAQVLRSNKLRFNKVKRDFLHPMTEQVQIPITQRLRIWKIDGTSGPEITMRLEHRLNVSLVGWTIAGYSKMATNGGYFD